MDRVRSQTPHRNAVGLVGAEWQHDDRKCIGQRDDQSCAGTTTTGVDVCRTTCMTVPPWRPFEAPSPWLARHHEQGRRVSASPSHDRLGRVYVAEQGDGRRDVMGSPDPCRQSVHVPTRDRRGTCDFCRRVSAGEDARGHPERGGPRTGEIADGFGDGGSVDARDDLGVRRCGRFAVRPDEHDGAWSPRRRWSRRHHSSPRPAIGPRSG